MKFRYSRIVGVVLGLVSCGCGKTETVVEGDGPPHGDAALTADAVNDTAVPTDSAVSTDTAVSTDSAVSTDTGAAPTSDAAMDAEAGSTLDAALPCGALSFAPAVPYDIPIGGHLRGLATGDLDGDRKPDLVVSNTDGTASVLLNKGDGSFAKAFTIPTCSNMMGGAVDVITFDANGDQKLDLAFVNFQNAVSVSLNKGGAVFDPPVDYVSTEAVTSVVAGDVTGDGKADLAVSVQSGAAGVLVNKGDGTFKSMVTYPVTGTAWTLAIADFDGVQHADLVVGTLSSSVSVLLNKGDGTFAAEKTYPTGSCYVTAADLGGDDKPDIAAVCGEVSVLLNMGNGTFEPKLSIGTSPRGRFVATDLLGRGRRDVVAPGPPLVVLLNQGNGIFGKALTFEYPWTMMAGSAVVSADFNGDAKPDLAVVTESTNGLAVLLNNTCTP